MVHDKESSIQAARRLVARQEEEEGGGEGDDGTGYTDPSWVEDDDDGNYSDPTYSDDGTQQQQQQVDATDTAYDDGSADPTYSDGTEQPTDTYYDDGGYYPTSTYLDGSEATDTAYDSYTATSTDYYDTETATATDYNPTPTDQQEISTTDAATPTDTDIANTESSYYSPITYTTQPATSVPEDVYTTTLYQDTLTAAATTTDAIAATPTPETTTSTQDDNPATSSDSPPTTLSSSASSAASPSIVLGTNECASDPSAVNGKCPSDSYCNAATSQCMKLLDNRSQCFEDFQCVSGHCNNNQCGDATDKSGPASLSGGQLAGITVGSVAGAVILFVLGAWLLKRKTRQVSQRARKFEQVRIEDDDLERSDYMFNGTGSSPTMLDEKAARRTSKFNLLAAMLTGGTAVARSFSRLGSSTNSNRQQPAVDRSSYTPSDFKQQDPLPEMQSINNVPPAGLRARESKIADLSNMQHEHDIQQKHQAASPALTDTQPEQMMGEHHKVTTAATGAIAGAAVATETIRNKDMQQENPYDDHTYYAQTLEPLTPMPAAHLDNNAMSNTDSYRNNAHQSWMSTASAIDPIGASGSTTNRDTIVADRPNTMALRESTFNNLHAPIFRLDGNREEMPNIVSSPIQSPASATSARNSWLLKEIASRWRQGSTSGALQEPSSSMEEGDNHNNNRRSSLLLGRSSELWDDALVSTASSVAERPMSYAETSTTITTSIATVTTHNPFRDSSHNPRDSLTLGNVMNAPLPPHIEQDAWSSEDHVSLSSNPRSTAAAYVNNNNNNGK